MDKQKYITQIRRLFNEVYSGGNIALMDQFFSNDVKLFDTASPNFKGGLAALKQKEQYYENAFPGKNFTLDDIFASDDNRVVVRWTCRACQSGQLDDIDPTDINVEITGVSIFVFKNDKITEIYQTWDRLGLLEQLGAIEEQTTALHR